jgi:hypothetical protein
MHRVRDSRAGVGHRTLECRENDSRGFPEVFSADGGRPSVENFADRGPIIWMFCSHKYFLSISMICKGCGYRYSSILTMRAYDSSDAFSKCDKQISLVQPRSSLHSCCAAKQIGCESVQLFEGHKTFSECQLLSRVVHTEISTRRRKYSERGERRGHGDSKTE